MPCPDERSETGARVFAVMVQKLVSITCVAPAPCERSESGVAVQTVSEPEIRQGAESYMRPMARIQVNLHYKFVKGAGVKAKTVTTSR
jgi:hypothetical protein